jgi:hypothetical protein
MIHAWIGLLMAVLIIVYLARDSFTSGDIPVWVRFILINLLVTYTLFGVFATVCYVMADSQEGGDDQGMILVGMETDRAIGAGFKRWVGCRLGYGLTILSAIAKLPIAFTVFYGLIGMPGDEKCMF